MIPILLIVIITFIMNVKNPARNSTELSEEETSTDDYVRIDYLDSEGNISFARDKGYATVIKTKKDGHVVLEQYFDEKGKLTVLPAGYAQISRAYEGGLNTEIIYLDPGNEPVVVSDGYDTIRRTYTDAGKADIDTYWIGDEQVERKQGYWQYQRVYDKANRICALQYLGQDGELVKNTSGYALIRCSYIDSATIDMYFDEDLQPAVSTLGQYGKMTETVDGTTTTTYLDAAGKPENTNRGYAVVKSEGTRTLYYDKDGNPVTIGRGQFGIEKVNGQNVYLDANGEQMIRIDNVLNTRPYLVLIFGVLMTMIAILVRGKVKVVFLICYIIFIGIMTIAFRESGNRRAVFELFKSYKEFMISPTTRQDILNNVWLFVPLGAALYDSGRPFRWLWAFALSIAIEVVQYFTGIGVCEFDDVFSNGLGALIGYVAAYSFIDKKYDRHWYLST
ncbi:MAG: VanZ family protein [Oribacterium sp.]|nr:VanZ family protein [Oribacterium sp.]